jgi:hypothetical protein
VGLVLLASGLATERPVRHGPPRTRLRKGTIRIVADQPQQLWLWVTHPRFTQDEADETQDRLDLRRGETGDYWTCAEQTRSGDLALLYVTMPFTEVRWLMRAEDEAYPLENDPIAQQEGWTHGCKCTVLERFAKTLTFQEMRQDQLLARWDAIARNLHGEKGTWPVPMAYWQRLVRRLTGRNPGTKEIFVENMRPPPDWL